MKIKKILNEDKKLITEDENKPEDLTLNDINPSAASVDTIADALAGSVEEVTGTEPASDAAVAQTAQEVKEIAQETDSGTVVMEPEVAAPKEEIDSDNYVGCENKLTRVLDKALATAQKSIRWGHTPDANVLVIGLPGSGKTSIVYDWAKGKVNVFYISAKDPNLESALYGMPARNMADPTSNQITHLRTTFLDALDRPNSVLFLDEINRGKDSNRAALLDLINKHSIVDPDYPDGNRTFPNLLFTISVMNPAGKFGGDVNAKPLSTAEASRYKYILRNMDSDPETSLDYVTKYWTKKIQKLDSADPYFWSDAIDMYKCLSLSEYILQHKDFAFDTEEDDDELNMGAGKFKQLNSRALTTGLYGISDPNEFLDWVRDESSFLQKDVDMLVKIVREYIQQGHAPSDAECKLAIAQIRNDNTPAETQPETQTTSDSAEITSDTSATAEIDQEDDEDLFSNDAGGTGAPTPASVTADIDNMMNGW